MAHNNPNSFWPDPISERLRQRNAQGDRRVIRDVLEDIEVLSLIDGQTFQDLSKCEFKVPNSYEAGRVYVQELRRVSAVLEHCKKALANPGAVLSDGARSVIHEARTKLMESVFVSSAVLESKHKFTLHWEERAIIVESKAFYAILQCTQMLNLDKTIYTSLARFGPKSHLFEGLAKVNLFNPQFANVPFLQYRVSDLYFLVQFIEGRWLHINFVPDELLYLFDLLLARLAMIATQPQPASDFKGLERYRKLIEEDVAVVTEVFLQDFFWALMPMYYQTLIRTEFEKYKAELPYEISDEESEKLKKDISDETKKKNSVMLQAGFQTAYMESALRPSEMKRYLRDNPGKEQLRSSVVSTMRGIEVRNAMSEKLAPLPWDIFDAGLLASHDLDMLILMMLDSKINNLSRNTSYSWLQDTVFFRIHMLEQESPVEWVQRMRRPIIVQAFNTFSLFHKDKFYDYQDAGRAFFHWLIIILTEYKGIVSGTNVKSLHTLLPAELKKQTGIKF